MGCDIHLYVERRVDGAWVSPEIWSVPTEEERSDVDYKARFYHQRNYHLFAVLADVRNGSGFAGVRTGDGFVPIATPRGLPDDCDARIRACSDAWGCDGHSHSHLTVAELLAYDWTQETRLAGIVNLQNWAHMKVRGCPDEWCAEAWGASIVVVSDEQVALGTTALADRPIYEYSRSDVRGDTARAELARRLGLPGKDVRVRVSWPVRYYESAAKFLSTTMPRLWRLGAPDDVRIVFWFDN